uniref:Putative secreted protein n=1 Tax=Anopheles darlingi TaxID=43151 RepID=A0A2M4DGY6_ANODA
MSIGEVLAGWLAGWLVSPFAQPLPTSKTSRQNKQMFFNVELSLCGGVCVCVQGNRIVIIYVHHSSPYAP